MAFLIPLFTSILLSYLIFVAIKRFNVFKKEDDFLIFSLSYLFLLGSISLQLFFYSILHVPFIIYTLLVPWLILLVFLIIFARNSFYINFNKEKIDTLSKFLLLLIILLFVFVAFESLLRPVSSWDAWSNWFMKSKMFFLDKDIMSSFNYLSSDYPIGISLFVTFFYIVLGKVDDTSVLILFFLFYFFTSLTLFSFTKRYMNLNVALFFTFLLASTQNIIRHGGRYEAGLADLALGYAILCASILLMMFLKSQKYKFLILLELAAVVCGFIKYEGIVYSLLIQIILMFYVIKNRKIKFVSIFFIWLIPTIGWWFYKLYIHVPRHYILSGGGVHSERLYYVIPHMVLEFLNIKNWNLLWPITLLCLISYRKHISKEVLCVIILLFMQLSIYILVYLATPIDYKAQFQTTIDRLYLHLVPSVFLVLALLLGPQIKMNKINLLRFSSWRKFITLK